jgi:hypothetical protein
MRKGKSGSFSAKAYQLRRIADKLIDICAVLKNVVNYYFVISILLSADY